MAIKRLARIRFADTCEYIQAVQCQVVPPMEEPRCIVVLNSTVNNHPLYASESVVMMRRHQANSTPASRLLDTDLHSTGLLECWNSRKYLRATEESTFIHDTGSFSIIGVLKK
jgi:hypothetical protein